VISLPWEKILDALPPFVALMVMFAIGSARGRRAEQRDMMHRTTQQAIIDTIVAFKEREQQVSIGDFVRVMPKWPNKIYPVIEHMLLTGKIVVINPLHAENMEPRFFDIPATAAGVDEPADLVITNDKEA
jgi:hypothetical protein